MRNVMFLLLVLFAASCVAPAQRHPHLTQAEVQPTTQSALTPGMIKKHIELNKTTQAEVLAMFGPPNMITSTGNGGEMWGYDKMSREVAQSSLGTTDATVGGIGGKVGAGILGFGQRTIGAIGGGLGVGRTSGYSTSSSKNKTTETTKTVFLLVYFNKEGKVINSKLSATKF